MCPLAHGPVSRERCARWLTGPFSTERCARWLTAVGPYGFFVGRGVGVGIGVRPTGGVANGFGLGDSDGFGVKPQMFQLKRP